jgi:hypothetical protein
MTNVYAQFPTRSPLMLPKLIYFREALKQKWLVLRMVIMDMMCSWFAVEPLSSFSVTVIGDRLAYITSVDWREISLGKILVISILGNKLRKNMLSSSYLFPNWGKIFLHPYLLHTYAFTHMPDCLRWSETGRIPYVLHLTHSKPWYPPPTCQEIKNHSV